MGKPCRLTFMAYADGMSRKAERHYDDGDLKNGIEYCLFLQEQGLTKEPLDGFSLQGFIDWATDELLL